MSVEKNTNYGNISISAEAVSSLAGSVIMESYGIVGMASRKQLRDGWAELIQKENYSKGVIVKREERGVVVDLYVIIGYNVRIASVVQEAQKKVKYELEKALNEEIAAVNVFVQGVRVIA